MGVSAPPLKREIVRLTRTEDDKLPVKAVLFDLGDTLVRYYRPSEFPAVLKRSVQSSMEALGLPHGPDQVEKLFERAKTLNRERDDHKVWPLADRLRIIFDGLIEFGDAQVGAASEGFLAPIFELARVDPDAYRVIDELRNRGLLVGIISNTPWGSSGSHWRLELERLGFQDRVDVCVFCEDVGWRKPHGAPFRRALEILSISPSDAVFVGDNPRWDVVGAKQAGVVPVLLAPNPEVVGADFKVIRSLGEILDLDEIRV